MTRRRVLVLMVASMLAAAILRLPALEEVPPGLHYDEAANGVLAADIALRGERPLFIPSYTGKEVLFFYGAALLMRLLGDSVFALRLAAAFFGLLTVAATYWLGRELLADRRVAVVAAALIAASFWHLLLSRLGFRAISQPLLQALAIAALFRGLHHNRPRWLAAAGIFLGLTAYTYLAARVFPLALALALLPFLLWTEKRAARLRQLAIFAGAAFLVAAPLLFYFYNHPDAFWVRIGQVAPDAVEPSLLRDYLRSLGMFFLVGDPYWRFNIPGRPLFNWWWGGLLVVGWGATLWRWRRWWYDWQKSAVLLLLLVPFIMILPTALAVGEIIPSNLRAVGLIPFIFYLPALGLVTLVEQIAGLFRRPGEQVSAFLRYLRLLEGYDVNYTFIVLLILLLGVAFTGDAYFQEWSVRSDLFYDSDADLVAVADFLNRAPPATDTVYVASLHYRHPTLAFLSRRYEDVKWLPESRAFVLPSQHGPSQHGPSQDDALYLYPHNSPAPAWTLPYLEPAENQTGPPGPDGDPTFVAYRLTEPPPVDVPLPRDANFGDDIRLLGYDVDPAAAGSDIPLTLFWEITGLPGGSVRPFVHLYDLWDNRWSQAETFAYPAEQWAVSETVIQRINVPVPPGTPPGAYQLRVGFFDPASGARLPRLDEEGRYAGDSLYLEDVNLSSGPPPDEVPRAPQGVPQQVRPGLQLLGYARADGAVATGETLPLTLWWWATQPQPPMTVRLQLMRGDNTGIILLDTRPAQGTYPFQRWRTPQFLLDRVDPTIPADLRPGSYRLHLRLLEAGGETAFTTSLGTVEVTATERSFEPPPVQHPLAATLGSGIKLLGYDLQQVEERRYTLSLVWQALVEPADDYTVFVHVLNQDGSCCLWQQDVMPRQGTYPTGRWLSGEVVVDDYQIDLPPDAPPGRYPIEIGLYLAENGRRLLVTMPGVPESDALNLRSLIVE